MSISPSFHAELAEILAGPPSALAFRALVAVLEAWPGEDGDEAYAAAGRGLEAWPDECRQAPSSWCRVQGPPRRYWPLVRAADWTVGRCGGNNEFGLLDLDPQVTAAWTILDLPHYGRRNVEALTADPDRWRGLRSLAVPDGQDALPPFDKEGGRRTLFGPADAGALAPLTAGLHTLHVGAVGADYFSQQPPRFRPDAQPDEWGLRAATLHGDDLMNLWDRCRLPRLRSVGLIVTKRCELAALAAAPEWAGVEELRVAFRCGSDGRSSWEPHVGNVIPADDQAAEAFFRAANLKALRSLEIVGRRMGSFGREGVGPEGLAAVCGSGLLGGLDRLTLRRLPLGREGLETLVARLPDSLRELTLHDVFLDGWTAAALSDAACVPALRKLDLSSNPIDDGAVAALARKLKSVEEVNLSGTGVNPYYSGGNAQPFGDGAVRELAGAGLKHLHTLRLSNTSMTEAGAAAVLGGDFPALHTLDLSHNRCGAEGTAALAAGPLAGRLRTLALDQCRLDAEAVRALAAAAMPSLRDLSLAYNHLDAEAHRLLADWPSLGNLWRLNLHDNFPGDDGLVALAESPYTTRLLELDFEQDVWNSRRADFGPAAIDAVLATPHWRRLDRLHVATPDEYHGATYPQTSRADWDRLPAATNLRAEAVAALAEVDLDWSIEDHEPDAEWEARRADHDFRTHENDAEPS